MFTQYYYKNIDENSIRLLRCFGESSEVIVPCEIEGARVTEIGPYCFSQNAHLKEGDYYISSVIGGEEDEAGEFMTEQAGRFITKVTLPDSIRHIGPYAFYNCRSLKELNLPGTIEEIANDTFMNCLNLHKLELRSGAREKSCLFRILAQIPWNIEVSMNEEAVLFYPEFLEYYEELGPAHVLELQISGEGFRARKAFHDGYLLFREYDGVFAKACAEENEVTLCRMASDRLLYSIELSEEAKQRYVDFVQKHGQKVAEIIFLDEEMELAERFRRLRVFFDEKWMDRKILESLLLMAAEKNIPEAAATFIRWKRELFTVSKKDRYDF